MLIFTIWSRYLLFWSRY